MMLLPQVDDLLLEEAAGQFLNGNDLLVRRLDNLPRAKTGRGRGRNSGRRSGVSPGAGGCNQERTDQKPYDDWLLC
jgi:hypothetical protein